ncbi:hypothetical protein [Streptococcus suis]|uniref:hypothetical protein n=1 Tax=Streptococcus suis TaxID=1307 RepID=UPI001ABEA156|nr:hypothetical protein [Streptococcus suis]
MKVFEKVVRISAKAYEFVVDFANKNDIKISEAVSYLIEYCATKNLQLKQAHVEVVEVQKMVEDVHE